MSNRVTRIYSKFAVFKRICLSHSPYTCTWVFGYVFFEIDNRRKVNRTSVTTYKRKSSNACQNVIYKEGLKVGNKHLPSRKYISLSTTSSRRTIYAHWFNCINNQILKLNKFQASLFESIMIIFKLKRRQNALNLVSSVSNTNQETCRKCTTDKWNPFVWYLQV